MGDDASVQQGLTIAIDGPAGAGKSTVSREVALRLGYTYIDSGAMYRAVAHTAIGQGIRLDNHDMCAQLAGAITITFDHAVPPNVFLDGVNVTPQLRTAELGIAASIVSQHAGVRTELVRQQQRLGEGGGIVMEGRDIGTVVFPDADVKIYLTATVAERARRRVQELVSRGQDVSLPTIMRQIEERDQRDMNRSDSPLRVADAAWEFVTDGVTIEEVINQIVSHIQKLGPQQTLDPG